MNNLFSTNLIHASKHDDGTGTVTTPIYLSSTYSQKTPGLVPGKNDPNSFGNGWLYSRLLNPTRGSLEKTLATLEYAKYAVTFSSGMATLNAIISILDINDHILCSDDAYGGTQYYMNNYVSNKFNMVDMTNLELLEKNIHKNTKLIWIESITNPLLKIPNIKNISKLAKKYNLILVVDSTFMSPYLQNPIKLGADIVVHSITKYINGHSDLIMGAAITNSNDIYLKLRNSSIYLGAVPSAFDSYLVLRGLKTLEVRMDKQCQNAINIANYLNNHPKIQKIIYPGLKSHPQYELAKLQQHKFGAMISFYINDNPIKFLEKLKIFTLAVSLGAVESLAECPFLMTHANVSPKDCEKLNININLIRLSIGIENVQDLIDDLKQALE